MAEPGNQAKDDQAGNRDVEETILKRRHMSLAFSPPWRCC